MTKQTSFYVIHRMRFNLTLAISFLRSEIFIFYPAFIIDSFSKRLSKKVTMPIVLENFCISLFLRKWESLTTARKLKSERYKRVNLKLSSRALIYPPPPPPHFFIVISSIISSLIPCSCLRTGRASFILAVFSLYEGFV